MLENLGNLGDFIGGVAVIFSLLYLGSQIRQHTRSVRAAAVQSAAQAFTQVMEMFARDADLLRLYEEGSRDFDALTPEEQRRFAAVMGVLLHHFENIHAQSGLGLLQEGSWRGGANRLRGSFARPGTRVWWERGKSVFNDDFQHWIDNEIIPSAHAWRDGPEVR